MPKSYPEAPKDQFEFLVQQAEGYINRPPTDRSLRQWRRRSLDWLKQNLPNSDLSYSLMGVPPNKIQQGLSVLIRARPSVPFLRETKASAIPKPKNTKKVFVVHGHNDALKESVARVLTRLGLEPIILHEQPNLGRTIIEKFLDHSDVGFAVVLLTPDDRGGAANESTEKYRYRARQNVVLELGFFLGHLGRERVVAIYSEGVEMPSDYNGVLYLRYDDTGGWQLPLAKEIREAGIAVDLNRL